MAYCDPENSTDYGLAGDTGSNHIDSWSSIYDYRDDLFTGNITILDQFYVMQILKDSNHRARGILAVDKKTIADQ